MNHKAAWFGGISLAAHFLLLGQKCAARKLSINKINISVVPLQVQKVRPIKQVNPCEKSQEFNASSSQKGSVCVFLVYSMFLMAN